MTLKMWASVVLSKPKTQPVSFVAVTDAFYIGSSCMQGWRTTFEDTHTIIVDDAIQQAYFGVFDGHGGYQVSDLLSKRLHQYIDKEAKTTVEMKEVLENAFLKMDMYMLQNLRKAVVMGSTAVVVAVREDRLYCANVGDSRAVAFVDGAVVALSQDHKVDVEEERLRVLEAGGFITDGRAFGRLSPTRAFGDFAFKQHGGRSLRNQAVTALPEVREFRLDDSWEFVVLACDGIWEVKKSEEVCDFVRERLARDLEPQKICEELMMACICQETSPEFELLGQDNMTVILIVLLGPAAKHHLTCSVPPVHEVKYICNNSTFRKVK